MSKQNLFTVLLYWNEGSGVRMSETPLVDCWWMTRVVLTKLLNPLEALRMRTSLTDRVFVNLRLTSLKPWSVVLWRVQKKREDWHSCPRRVPPSGGEMMGSYEIPSHPIAPAPKPPPGNPPPYPGYRGKKSLLWVYVYVYGSEGVYRDLTWWEGISRKVRRLLEIKSSGAEVVLCVCKRVEYQGVNSGAGSQMQQRWKWINRILSCLHEQRTQWTGALMSRCCEQREKWYVSRSSSCLCTHLWLAF